LEKTRFDSCQDAGFDWPGGVPVENIFAIDKLEFVKVNSGIYVSDRVILKKLSWEDLHEYGLIYGRPIRVHRNNSLVPTVFLCRSLKVGGEEGVRNEWDDILDATGTDDELWHCSEAYFWGQEAAKGTKASRARRGARRWTFDLQMSTNNTGFRPVLEPIEGGGPDLSSKASLIEVSDPVAGMELRVSNGMQAIYGILRDASEYDLVLKPTGAPVTPDIYAGWGIQTEDDLLIVDRSKITNVEEVNY